MTKILLQSVSKTYAINPFKKGKMQKSLRDDFWGMFKRKKTSGHEDFYALKDINLSFSESDSVGIIGANGSGKSTLLKLISQVTLPSSGEITIQGNVSSLLGIGVGFHSDLSGKENIFLAGALLGYKKKDIEKEFDNIVAFSGIGKFIHTPIKFYSSGMYTRLAFSIATAACNTPDILLLDEVLAVGDEAFKLESLERIKDLTKEKKRIVLLVSHDLYFLKDVCQKCLWLDKGMVKAFGPTQVVLNQYIQSSTKK